MKKTIFFIASLLPYLFVFLATLSHPSDPDLGWHLKYGEYFFKHFDVLRENIFSTMMPDYAWANTSWGTDVITYGAYLAGGFLGLAIASSLIVSATFFFFSRAAKLSLWDQAFLFPILVYFVNPINSISFRGQQVSLFLTGVMFFLLSLAANNRKIAYLLIPLFLLWVNLHGQFFLGLALFGIWISIHLATIYITSGKEKRHKTMTEFKFWFIIFALSSIATLLNPSGVKIYTDDLIRHFNNPNLPYVAEYAALSDQSQLFRDLMLLLVLMVIGLMSHFFSRSFKKYTPEIVLSFILFGLTLFVRRYAWTMFYTTMPILAPVFSVYKPRSTKWSTIVPSIILLLLISYVVWDKPNSKITNMSWETYCNYDVSCSRKSMEFLVDNKESLSLTRNPEKFLTLYSWGGFMIWNYPSIKPAIDGRMHLWRDKDGYSAFEEYYALEQGWTDINKSRFDIVYMSPQKPLYGKLLSLSQKGEWRQIYKDEKSGIFARTK